ncbi:MAG: CbtA family protein [Alphaproteobacteria bacterium]|nr:CbtA family protein [Alphaproteobacteria bacterium]
MVGALLVRGMLVGLVAGLLGFGFAKVVGEPQVDKAIAFESRMDHQREADHAHEHGAHAHEHGMDHAQGDTQAAESELVSRAVQSTIGLLTGVVVYGTAFGGLFALVFAYASGRVGRIGPRGLSALLALAGFIAIVLVPQLKYPANPPAVGDPDTIGYRTGLFFLMLALSIATMVLAVQAGRRLHAAHGLWTATLSACAVFIVIVAAMQLLLPDINEVPDEFPAVVLWRFRMAALGMQLVMWTSLGLLFGWLTERSLRSRTLNIGAA